MFDDTTFEISGKARSYEDLDKLASAIRAGHPEVTLPQAARGPDGAWSFTMKDGWKKLADLPRPNVAAPAPAPFQQGKFLLVGGDDGSRVGFQPITEHPGFPKGILAYDPVADRWSQLEEVPAPRATVPCVEWQGKSVIPSGEVRPGVRSPEIWSLSPH